MDSEKYIGLDVHQATISVAVTDSTGRIIMESILDTKAATILEFFAGLRGTLTVSLLRLDGDDLEMVVPKNLLKTAARQWLVFYNIQGSSLVP
jgi:hypothetical protein